MSTMKFWELAAVATVVVVLVAVWAGGMYLLICCGAAIEAPEHIKCMIMKRC